MPYIVDPEYGNLGAKVFFIWGGTCAGCILFAYFFIPETVSISVLGPIPHSKWIADKHHRRD